MVVRGSIDDLAHHIKIFRYFIIIKNLARILEGINSHLVEDLDLELLERNVVKSYDRCRELIQYLDSRVSVERLSGLVYQFNSIQIQPKKKSKVEVVNEYTKQLNSHPPIPTSPLQVELFSEALLLTYQVEATLSKSTTTSDKAKIEITKRREYGDVHTDEMILRLRNIFAGYVDSSSEGEFSSVYNYSDLRLDLIQEFNSKITPSFIKSKSENVTKQLKNLAAMVNEASFNVDRVSKLLNEQSTKLNEQSTKLNEQSTKLNNPSTKLNNPSTKLNNPSTKLNEQSTKLNMSSKEFATIHNKELKEIRTQLIKVKSRILHDEYVILSRSAIRLIDDYFNRLNVKENKYLLFVGIDNYYRWQSDSWRLLYIAMTVDLESRYDKLMKSRYEDRIAELRRDERINGKIDLHSKLLNHFDKWKNIAIDMNEITNEVDEALTRVEFSIQVLSNIERDNTDMNHILSMMDYISEMNEDVWDLLVILSRWRSTFNGVNVEIDDIKSTIHKLNVMVTIANILQSEGWISNASVYHSLYSYWLTPLKDECKNGIATILSTSNNSNSSKSKIDEIAVRVIEDIQSLALRYGYLRDNCHSYVVVSVHEFRNYLIYCQNMKVKPSIDEKIKVLVDVGWKYLRGKPTTSQVNPIQIIGLIINRKIK
jgi:hypothetical protein